MSCCETNYCSNPNIINTDDNLFCMNCYASFKKDKNISKPVQVNKYRCRDNVNILYQDDYDVCVNCGTMHEKYVENPTYLENDIYIKLIYYINRRKYIYHINIYKRFILKLNHL